MKKISKWYQRKEIKLSEEKASTKYSFQTSSVQCWSKLLFIKKLNDTLYYSCVQTKLAKKKQKTKNKNKNKKTIRRRYYITPPLCYMEETALKSLHLCVTWRKLRFFLKRKKLKLEFRISQIINQLNFEKIQILLNQKDGSHSVICPIPR